MKVRVDYDLCEGNAYCMRDCPEVFQVDEDDNITILCNEIPADYLPRVKAAVLSCPRQALALDD